MPVLRPVHPCPGASAANQGSSAGGVGVPGVTSYGAGFEEIARGVRDGNLQVLTGDAQKLVRILEENIETKDKFYDL